MIIANDDGSTLTSQNASDRKDPTDLEATLQEAQQEVVEQEIFSLLVQEAGNLSTASARVSERLIVIDAAETIELRFELVRWSKPCLNRQAHRI
jgi:mediator of RNA polymerase II transcription subunit 17